MTTEIKAPIKMTYEEWVEAFKPRPSEDGGDIIEFDVRDVGPNSYDVHHVWTRVEGDDGRPYIIEGWHFVNRECYYVTEGSWADGQSWEIPWMDEDTEWCDDCGDLIEGAEKHPWESLPVDVDSACRGESAVLCKKCDTQVRTAESRLIEFTVEVLLGTRYTKTVRALSYEDAYNIGHREADFDGWDNEGVERQVTADVVEPF